VANASSDSFILKLARKMLPQETRAAVIEAQRKYGLQWPRTGRVKFGDLRRLTPISRIFGMDRGRPIDRYYIEKFLAEHSGDIKGRAMELGDATYIKRFGAGVTQIDVLHVVEGNPEATIIADLTNADHIPSDAFDCIIFTQALQMIYDMRAAMRTLYRILKPGGVLLMTTHGTSKIARRLGRDDWGEYWRLTAQGVRALVDDVAPGAELQIQSYGNVLSAAAFLYGLSVEDLKASELDADDDDFEVILGARMRKPAEPSNGD
jgi:SAM-dependent methyltransferase